MRTILSAIFLVSVLGGCTLTEMADLAGESLADELLRNDLISAIDKSLPIKTGCPDRISRQNIRKTVISKPLNNGLWQEVWSVETCGKTNDVTIDLSASPSGGTDFSISLD